MVKFEDSVNAVIKKLENAGFVAYATGPCVRKAYVGKKNPYWDVMTDAPIEKVQELVADGELIGAVYTVYSDYIDEAGELYEGAMSIDITTMSSPVEKELKKYNFTVDALADNPQRKFVDPYNGIDDLKNLLINAIGNPKELFTMHPEMMLNAIYLVGETGGKLGKETYLAMKECAPLTKKLDKEIIRDYLENIIVTDHTGIALELVMRLDMLHIIYGEDVAGSLNRSERNDLKMYFENVDQTMKNPTRRIGALYVFLSKVKMMRTFEEMQYEEPFLTNLLDIANDYISMQFLNNPMQFKKFVFEHGMDRYLYLHNLAKAVRIIFDQPQNRIESRNWYMQTAKTNHEPIFVEDMVIDANDLLQAGIAKNAEEAKELLNYTVAAVHKNPLNNKRDVLLSYAKKMARSPIARKSRYVNWLR